MTTNANRDFFQAQNKLENLVIDQMWTACYATQIDYTDEGLKVFWIEKSEQYESDKEKAMKVLNEYGYKFPEA